MKRFIILALIAVSGTILGNASPARPIAILPFATLGADEGTKSFAAGLEQGIITRLTQQHVSSTVGGDIRS